MTDRVAGGGEDQFELMLRRLADGRVEIGWLPVDIEHVGTITSAESTIVGRAVPVRRAEFSTGRMLLRRLIGRDVEILRSENGAPALPDDVVGSLAHDRGLAVAAVGTAHAVRAVGVDVEPIQELDPAVAEMVVRLDDVVPDPITAFVAKEAAYKAWSVLGGEMLDHHDVRVVADGGGYTAELDGTMTVRGEIGRAAGRVVALVVIPAT